MCEIAVLDPEQSPVQVATEMASVFDSEQGDGLGILAVIDNGDSFEYNTYKSTEPHWATMFAFLKRNWDEAYRVVIHGRASTTGAVNRQNAHPLGIECSQCEFDWVVHNGSVRQHKNIRSSLTTRGHYLNTGVDSEILAHRVSELPDTVEDHDRRTYTFTGNLNYLLFSENGILVRVSDKYHLSDDFRMTCRPELDGFVDGTDNEWMLISPGGEIETKERSSRTYTNTSASRQRQRNNVGWGGNAGYKDENRETTEQTTTNTGSETITITYKNLAHDLPDISVFKVAPGVLRIINKDENTENCIKKSEYPKVYYHWVDEARPDNLEQLAEIAKKKREADTPEEALKQITLSEYDDESESDSVRESVDDAVDMDWAESLAEEEDNLTVEQVADVARGVETILD